MNQHKIEVTFARAMKDAGLGDTVTPADGRLHRFRTSDDRAGQRTGWAVLHADGAPTGVAGNWRTGERFNWHPKGPVGPRQKDAINEVRKRRQQEDEERHRRAAAKAAALYERLPPAPANHAYLTGKRIEPGPCRITAHGALAIPLFNAETSEMVSLQYIFPDGSKRFLAGGSVAGGCITLGDTADSGPLVIAEGFATASSIAAATGWPTVAAFTAGNLVAVARAMRKRYPDREIIIAADNDVDTKGNPGITKGTAAKDAIGASMVAPPGAGDFNDFYEENGVEALRQRFAARGSNPDHGSADNDEIARLAKLPRFDYERARETKSKELGVRLGVLDKAVERARGGDEPIGDSAVESDRLFSPIEPATDPVDGADLLDEIEGIFTKHLVLPSGAADAMALWTLHAHAHDTSEISPILTFTSPTPECGKTTALSLIGAVVPRPLAASNITAAAVFRSVEKWNPTLLVDEADTFLKANDELRGVINSGHSRRSAFVIRVVGENLEPARFSTWTPKAIAFIGKLPPTLASRSIHIEMRRMAPGETVEPVRIERLDFTDTLRRAARWTQDHDFALRRAEPDMPAPLTGRRADNWRHLLAIADIAGGGWAERARRAAETLSATGSEEMAQVMLLEDISAIFTELGVDRVTSTELVETLVEIETRPWGDWSKGKPMTARQLARLLAPFKIVPGSVRTSTSSKTSKGYKIEQFDDAFSRYLRIDPAQRHNPQKTAKNTPSTSGTTPSDVPDRKGPKPAESVTCAVVPDGIPEKPGNTTYQGDDEDAEYDRLERLAIQTEDFFDIPDHLKREPGVSTT